MGIVLHAENAVTHAGPLAGADLHGGARRGCRRHAGQQVCCIYIGYMLSFHVTAVSRLVCIDTCSQSSCFHRAEKRASPLGSRQKPPPPAYDDEDAADDDEALEEVCCYLLQCMHHVSSRFAPC